MMTMIGAGRRLVCGLLATLCACAATAQELSEPGDTQLLLLGADTVPLTAPADLPTLLMQTLPDAAAAEGEVFASRLRANPVTTFVSTPEASEDTLAQIFLAGRIGLTSGTEGFAVTLGGETLTLEAFAERVAAVVDAFQPQNRRLAVLEVFDTEDKFPTAVREMRAALDVMGFDLNVVMIRDTAGPEACGDHGVLYDLLSGVADRAPFGDANGVSSQGEVQAYLEGALTRAATREDACSPDYNLLVKSNDAASAPLIAHAGLPPFSQIETQIYHETFEARFLLDSEDTQGVQAFLATCIYCPQADELSAKLQTMQSRALAAQLEDEVWEQIKDDTATGRIAIYLETCTLCIHGDVASARVSELDAKLAARDAELIEFRAAAQARDLGALETYVETCIACAEQPEAKALIAEIRNDVAYRAERETLEAALASRDPRAVQAYLDTCNVCDGAEEAEVILTEAARVAELSGPCFVQAGLPQQGGPRKLEDIFQPTAMNVCGALLAEFPNDGPLTTIMGRIAQAAGNYDDARAAFAIGMEAETPAAFGLAAFLAYAPPTGDSDIAKAEDLATQGAALGDWLSKEVLTLLYSKGLVEGKSAEDAYALAQVMAAEDNPLAQFFLGYFHQNGIGVEASATEAEAWLSKSVEQGYLHAFSFLAELYEDSDGELPAPERAAELYWSALQEGDPTAADRLTVQLENRDQEVIRVIQERLRDEGVYTGDIDGIAGPGTVAAITRYAQAVLEAG